MFERLQQLFEANRIRVGAARKPEAHLKHLEACRGVEVQYRHPAASHIQLRHEAAARYGAPLEPGLAPEGEAAAADHPVAAEQLQARCGEGGGPARPAAAAGLVPEPLGEGQRPQVAHVAVEAPKDGELLQAQQVVAVEQLGEALEARRLSVVDHLGREHRAHLGARPRTYRKRQGVQGEKHAKALPFAAFPAFSNLSRPSSERHSRLKPRKSLAEHAQVATGKSWPQGIIAMNKKLKPQLRHPQVHVRIPQKDGLNMIY